jgi:hypothetical protein
MLMMCGGAELRRTPWYTGALSGVSAVSGVSHCTHEESGYSEEDSEEDGKEVASVTSETALFAGHGLMLDSQSSTSVVFDQSLLLNEGSIRRAAKGIILNGVDKNSPGIHVDLVGELRDIGTVYYCPTASANILSFAVMTDSGADIRYAAKHDRLTMKPKGSDMIYSFCRQDLPGSEGRFYICDTRRIIATTTVSSAGMLYQKLNYRLTETQPDLFQETIAGSKLQLYGV